MKFNNAQLRAISRLSDALYECGQNGLVIYVNNGTPLVYNFKALIEHPDSGAISSMKELRKEALHVSVPSGLIDGGDF